MMMRASSSSAAASSSGRIAHSLPSPVPPVRPPADHHHPASAAAAATALAALLAFAPAPPALAAPTPANSPLLEAKNKGLVFGPTPDGSIRPCQGNIQPNCVSTASNNQLFSPPWKAPLTVDETARALERSVPAAEPSARLLRSVDDLAGTGAAYRAWQTDGVFGADIFEVVVKPESSGAVERGAAAAEEASPSSSSSLITYRSSATEVKYVYPFQIVVTDGGAQRKRATAVRAASNFSLIGCSEIECFLE